MDPRKQYLFEEVVTSPLKPGSSVQAPIFLSDSDDDENLTAYPCKQEEEISSSDGSRSACKRIFKKRKSTAELLAELRHRKQAIVDNINTLEQIIVLRKKLMDLNQQMPIVSQAAEGFGDSVKHIKRRFGEEGGSYMANSEAKRDEEQVLAAHPTADPHQFQLHHTQEPDEDTNSTPASVK